MSDILERLRRLHGLREQKNPDSPPARAPLNSSPGTADTDAPATETPGAQVESPDEPDNPFTAPPAQPWIDRATSPQSLVQAVPGTLLETEAGPCYVSTYAYPVQNPRGDFPLGTLLEHPPRILDSLHAVGVAAAERRGRALDYSQAAFIDTETSGLGTGSCCFMVGVGAFESHPALPSPHSHRTDHTAPLDPHLEDPNAIALREQSDLHWTGAPPLASPEDATHFVVRQFFMRHPGEETALLAALATTLAQYTMTVTFNGRSFDLPLLRSRFRLHRHFLPASINVPDLLDERNIHVDLLPPARRLWKRRLQSCRLINLEQKILHLYRSEADVPGHLIPMLYVNFTRNGDARAMRQVFYHNREDIVSMVGIATHLATTVTSASGTVDGGASPIDTSRGRTATKFPTSGHNASPRTSGGNREPETSPADGAPQSLHGHEWLALGQHYAKSDRPEEALAALQQATQTLTNQNDRALAFAELATLYKRRGDWAKACETWQLWISSVAGSDPTPYIELAKYCEWQTRELGQAEMWCAWAVHNLQQTDPRSQHRARLGELEHRLARIRRKRANFTGAK